ncbi:MAG TPA: phospholipase C, phosphocholine-specific [Puia sp.]|jgi:phospholipase C|nr:phospholipase C, phosphocholine-specific [Puia sp.]
MDTRRGFLKKSLLASGALGVSQFLPLSIQKALAINPAAGSTYLDAEYIVILMQENRSFDHAYGTLRGVRGFNDPRALKLPGKNIAWLQTNRAGETYSPFRLDIKDTKITWMGSLPHGRKSQMDARNNGAYDGWLEAKKSSEPEYAKMPLTMGHYTREDIPFYYALADAFTVCDQNFCSSLTGTDPNRSYFWTGNVRAKLDENKKPYVQNEDIENGVEWPTFPERLEQQGISWKVYQNEIAADGGFTEEEDVWLGNFGDNPLEYFKQYNVKLSKRYVDYLPKKIVKLGDEIKDLQTKIPTLPEGRELTRAQRNLKEKQKELEIANEEQKTLSNEKYDALNEFQKNIHQKAFAVNTKDPDQHKLEPLNYKDGDTERNINIPKGDIFHQFREDVETGKLPTVSWLVAPEFFSDHPSAPWFGSWYLSEAMDILTKNPEVWKKTIFILAYDENDGYFDHVPPFVAPDPRDPATGKVSGGIDTSVEHVRLLRDSPGSIGLGYRVPLVIASPWSRGGWVNSQVFDHTSTIQFLEGFLSKKFGKKIEEPNISQWRRTVCGDLTSTFRPDNGEKINGLPFLAKDNFIESVHKAKFKNPPNNFKNLSKDEIELVNRSAHASPFMPQQEKGTREACALPYELYVDGRLSDDKKMFWLKIKASNEIFGDKTAGSPFSVYAPGKTANEKVRLWSYGVAAGYMIKEQWSLNDFENNNYHLFIHGPNGFYREFKGDANDPQVEIMCAYQNSSSKKLTGNIEFKIDSSSASPLVVEITDNAYKTAPVTKTVNAKSAEKIIIDLNKSHGWYDVTVKIKGNNIFEKRYAGHVETGNPSRSDPLMGGEI